MYKKYRGLHRHIHIVKTQRTKETQTLLCNAFYCSLSPCLHINHRINLHLQHRKKNMLWFQIWQKASAARLTRLDTMTRMLLCQEKVPVIFLLWMKSWDIFGVSYIPTFTTHHWLVDTTYQNITCPFWHWRGSWSHISSPIKIKVFVVLLDVFVLPVSSFLSMYSRNNLIKGGRNGWSVFKETAEV